MRRFQPTCSKAAPGTMRQSLAFFGVAFSMFCGTDSVQPWVPVSAGRGMPAAFKRCTLTTVSRSTWMLPKRADFTLSVCAVSAVMVP